MVNWRPKMLSKLTNSEEILFHLSFGFRTNECQFERPLFLAIRYSTFGCNLLFQLPCFMCMFPKSTYKLKFNCHFLEWFFFFVSGLCLWSECITRNPSSKRNSFFFAHQYSTWLCRSVGRFVGWSVYSFNTSFMCFFYFFLSQFFSTSSANICCCFCSLAICARYLVVFVG